MYVPPGRGYTLRSTISIAVKMPATRRLLLRRSKRARTAGDLGLRRAGVRSYLLELTAYLRFFTAALLPIPVLPPGAYLLGPPRSKMRSGPRSTPGHAEPNAIYGVAGRDEQGPPVRLPECDVRRTDLPLGLPAGHRQIEIPE